MNLIRRVITSDDFWVPSGNHAIEQSVEISEESKTVKVKGLSPVNQVLQCEGHRPLRVIPIAPEDRPEEIMQRIFHSEYEKRQELWENKL